MKLILQGGLIAVCTMTAFHLGLNQGGAAVGSTMAFCTLTLARLFHGFNCRSSHSIFRIGFSGNWYSLGAFLAGVALLERLFSVAPLTGSQIGLVYLLAVIPTVVIQLTKIVREQRH